MKAQPTRVTFNKVETIRTLPGTWTMADYRRALSELDVDDIDSYSETEIPDVALMSLQDIGEDDAATFILSNFANDQFTKGQIQNLCEEIKEEGAWDEYADIVDHKALYICIDILNAAFPKVYPTPSLRHLQLQIQCPLFESDPEVARFDAQTVLRIVANCEDVKSRLNRLYGEQLAQGDFPESEHIIWLIESSPSSSDSRIVDCYGSAYWFQDIEQGLECSIDFDWK